MLNAIEIRLKAVTSKKPLIIRFNNAQRSFNRRHILNIAFG